MTKLRPAAAPSNQAFMLVCAATFAVRAAIGEPAAGGIIAGPEAGELIADIQQPIPILQSHLAIDAELQQLDAVDVPLDGVGVNRRVGIVWA